jgi:hypothetical protein
VPPPAEPVITTPAPPASPLEAATAAEETASMDAKIDEFVANVPVTPPLTVPPAPDEPIATPVSPEPTSDTPIPNEPPTADIAVQEAPEPTSENPGVKANELADAVNKIIEASDTPPTASASSDEAAPPSGKKIIAPITNEAAPTLDLNELLAIEEAKEVMASSAPVQPTVSPAPASQAPDPTQDTPTVIKPSTDDPANLAL